MVTYNLRPVTHLGDLWAGLNYLIHLGEPCQLTSPKSRQDILLECLQQLAGTSQLTYIGPNQPYDKHIWKGFPKTAYHLAYNPTHLRWSGPSSQTIAYALDCRCRRAQKTPPEIGTLIPELQRRHPDYRFIQVGHRLGLTRTIQELAAARLVVTLDSAIAHIARSVGIPLYIIQHTFPVKRVHPAGCYTKCQGVQGTIDRLEEALARPNIAQKVLEVGRYCPNTDGA